MPFEKMEQYKKEIWSKSISLDSNTTEKLDIERKKVHEKTKTVTEYYRWQKG